MLIVSRKCALGEECHLKLLPSCEVTGIVGGGVHIGCPRGTAAMYWPIVSVPGDCEDGEVGGRGNRSTLRKTARLHFVHHKSHLPDPGANPGCRGGKPGTNRLSYGAA
jgi:hypothetical protein